MFCRYVLGQRNHSTGLRFQKIVTIEAGIDFLPEIDGEIIASHGVVVSAD